MSKATIGAVTAGVISALLWATPSFAEDATAGKEGAGAAPQGGAARWVSRPKAKPVPALSGERSASRALDLDPQAAAKAFTIVGRTSEGKDVNIPPAQNVLDAISSDGKRSKLEGGGEDPAEGGARNVVGQDSRVQVTNSTSYPFSTVGYLQTENKKGEVWGCTAAMIGPKVALTAASCLYDHNQEGGWFSKIIFWPAVNGENNVPYGGFDFDTAYVFNAFITDYDGTYDTIWQYDVGLVVFKDPIGDSLGWLGYTGSDFGDLQATLVGYHDDKPAFTMWKSTCNIMAENVGQMDFVHDCDNTGGAMGAPIYFYDQQQKSRFVVGVHIGPAGDTNWGIRLYGPIFEWMNTLNK
jgi:V8-like Glu-specific endopeptidase